MKKILVPMDFSHCAINALRIAKEIALQLHSTIEMVTSVHMPHLHAEAIGAGSLVQPMLADYHHQIDQNYKELYEKEGLNEVAFETKKFTTTVQNAIYSCVERGDIGLVVTGTRESHDVFERILGGNSTDFISISKVPVLVIPEGVEKLNIRKIGLALNLEEEIDTDKLEMARNFATLFSASVDILFIDDQSEKRFLFDDNRVMLSEYFGEITVKFVNVKDHLDKSGKQLLKLVEEKNLDMLYMHPKNHKLWERIFNPSLTKQVAMDISIPLLSVHE